MKRLFICSVLAMFLFQVATVEQILAHSGGLNQYGCHNETATGGYHCHEDEDDAADQWARIGIALGALVVGYVVYLWWTADEDDTTTLRVKESLPKQLTVEDGHLAYTVLEW